MIPYYILFGFVLLLAIIELSGHKIGIAIKWLVVIVLLLISGLRYNIGNDFINYTYIYEKSAGYERIEYGFKLLVDLLNGIGCDQQLFFFITASLSLIPLAITINKYTPQYFVTAIATYVLSFTYFEGMNTVRQAMAMAILLYAFSSYAKEFKNKKFILLSLLATSFHLSAIIVALVGWLLIRFITKHNRIGFISYSLALIGSFFLGYFIKDFFEQIDYLSVLFHWQDYMDKFEQRGVSGGTYHLVLNAYAFFIALFAEHKKGRLNLFESTCVSFFILSVVIYNFFFNFYIGIRLYWYFFVFLVFLIPIILSSFKRVNRPLVYLVLILIFSIYTIASLYGNEHYDPYLFNIELF